MSEENNQKNQSFYEASLVFFMSVVTFLAFSWLLMYSWNGVVPALFKLSNISFGESCCLLMLRNILVTYKDNSIQSNQSKNNNQSKER
jgi:hypothetical protein